MDNIKWGIISLVAVFMAIVSGGIAIFFLVTLAVSLKKYLHVSMNGTE